MFQTTLIGHVKDMDYARRHRILRVFPKRFFSVCDRLGPDLFLFMKTLGVFLHDQTLFGCSIFQNGAHCPHPINLLDFDGVEGTCKTVKNNRFRAQIL